MTFCELFIYVFFGHFLGDFIFQTSLVANLKQKQYWINHKDYKDLYKYDYIVGLFIHSFCWTFCIMFPLLYVNNFTMSTTFIIVFIVNILIHMYIDDLKANKFKINFITDQLAHIVQMIISIMILSIF